MSLPELSLDRIWSFKHPSTMTIRKLPGLLLFLASGLLLQAGDRPNILFIAVDDLKPMLGAYGDETVKSPQIDRLASDGTTFLNAHCQQAVCGPSRASLLTGLRPDSTKVWDLKTKIRKVNPDVVTLPQHFKQNGYTSVGVGKIFDFRSVEGGHQTDDPASWSRPYVVFPDSGMTEYGIANPDYVAMVRAKKAEMEKKGVKGYFALKKVLGSTPAYEGTEDVPDDTYDDGQIAKTGVRLIEELSPKDEPFFIAVGFKKPHLPFVAPKKYWDLYDRSQFQPHPLTERPKGSPSYHHQPGFSRVGNFVTPTRFSPISEVMNPFPTRKPSP
jgi:arylsulfatase A-like enzyme